MSKNTVIVLVGVAVIGGAIAFVATRPGDDAPVGRTGEPGSNDSSLVERALAPVAKGKSWDEIDNPEDDGWSTEVLHEAVSAQLAEVAKILKAPRSKTPITETRTTPFVAPGFKMQWLVPSADLTETSFESESIIVERAKTEFGEGHLPFVEAGSLAMGFEAILSEFSPSIPEHVKFKIFRIERDSTNAKRFTTVQYVSLYGRIAGSTNGDRAIEINTTWNIVWDIADPPRMVELAMTDFERVRRRTESPLLVDCTESILGTNPSYRSQLLLGLNHWLERLQDRRFFALLGTPGLAIGDVNGDGLDDLYLAQEGGLPNRLFVQNPDGSATDVSAKSGADFLESCRSALLVDLDNDGHQDLVATLIGSLLIASGRGDGTFETRTVLPTSHDTMSLSAADYDLDGYLDLYVCAYKRDDDSRDAGVVSIGANSSFVYHDANNAAANYLFRNEIDREKGTWTFRDVTAAVGIDVNNRRFSFAAAWEDFDGDGDLDLYVANDFGRNNLYRHDRQPDGSVRFTDVAASANAEDSASGMSVTWSDYDRDGRPDVYISNMFSAAGNRITTQREFKPSSDPTVKTRLTRFARGNTLLRGRPDGGLNGDPSFADTSIASRVTMGRWAWGSNFVDLDGDGWDDILVANGYITTNDTGDL